MLDRRSYSRKVKSYSLRLISDRLAALERGANSAWTSEPLNAHSHRQCATEWPSALSVACCALCAWACKASSRAAPSLFPVRE